MGHPPGAAQNIPTGPRLWYSSGLGPDHPGWSGGHPGWSGPGHPPVLVAPRSPAGQPLASFGDRFLAYLIDSAITIAVGLVLAVPMVFVLAGVFADTTTGLSPTTNPDGSVAQPDLALLFTELFLPMILLQTGYLVLMLAAYYGYFVELMFKTGQTVGKRVMKLRTVPLDPAATLTRGMATRRYLLQFVVGGFVPVFTYLDGLWQLWDKPYQQCLHDKVARTVVVKVPG